MNKRIVVIDAATIYPGKGGAGGGIWSYALNLLQELDNALQKGEFNMKIVCLVNRESNLVLENIEVKKVPFELQNILVRLFYIHLYLPVYCLFKKSVLHKLYFEAPYFPLNKTLVTIHDCMGDFYKGKTYSRQSIGQRLKAAYFNFINSRAITNSNFICTPSQFIKDELVNNYRIQAEKVIVTPLASYAKIQENFQIEKEASPINIYCIAAFHPHKGHLRLLDVFEILLKEYKITVNLYLRGHVPDNAYYSEVLNRINKSSAKQNIFLIKYEARSKVEDIYRDADWVILLSEYEGFGLPVIEAQTFGTPVICSDIQVFREVGGDSVAYLENDLTPFSAAKKLYQLLNDDDIRKRIIQMGLSNAKRYSWKKFANQMIDIYKVALTA